MSPATSDPIVDALRSAGIEPRVHDAALFLSTPERAHVVLGVDRFDARPASFSRATGNDVVEGALCLVDDLERPDEALGGRIALLEGPLTPETVFTVERRGALAQIYIEPSDALPARNASTIWGAPTHESVGRKPR